MSTETRRVWLSVLLGLLAAPPLVSPAAAQERNPAPPFPPLERIEGSFSFSNPATADAAVEFQRRWLVQWSGGEAMDAFDFQGAELQADYYEWTTEGSDFPLRLPRAPLLETTVLERFDVGLLRLDGPRELLLEGNTKVPLPTEVRPRGDWRLSTLDPAQRIVTFSEPAAGASPAFRPGHTMVLIEGDAADVTTGGAGALYLFGYRVRIQHAEGEYERRTGRWQETPLGPLGPTTHKESMLVLRPTASSLRVVTQDRPVRVIAPTLALTGAVDVADLAGEIAWGDRDRTFAGDPVQLRGVFLFSAEPSPAPRRHALRVSGMAEPVEAAADASTAARLPWIPILVAAGTSVVGALLGLRLFSCLRRDRVVEGSRRALIVEAVRSGPGVRFPELLTRLGIPRSSLRHHLRVLERHGDVRSFKTQGTWCYALAGENPRLLRQELLLARDASLRALVALVPREGDRAHRVVQRLRADCGLSRSAGWDVVERAAQAGLLVKVRQGAAVVLEPAGQAPSAQA